VQDKILLELLQWFHVWKIYMPTNTWKSNDPNLSDFQI